MSFFNSMIWVVITFLFFTALVAVISAVKTRGDQLDTNDGYFLAGRGLPGLVIAGSLLLTNLSAEQLVGTNGQGDQYEPDGIRGRFSVHAARTGILFPADVSEIRRYDHAGADGGPI